MTPIHRGWGIPAPRLASWLRGPPVDGKGQHRPTPNPDAPRSQCPCGMGGGGGGEHLLLSGSAARSPSWYQPNYENPRFQDLHPRIRAPAQARYESLRTCHRSPNGPQARPSFGRQSGLDNGLMDFFSPAAAAVDRQIVEGHRGLVPRARASGWQACPHAGPDRCLPRLHLKQFMPEPSSVSGSVTAIELRRLQSLHKQAVIGTRGSTGSTSSRLLPRRSLPGCPEAVGSRRRPHMNAR